MRSGVFFQDIFLWNRSLKAIREYIDIAGLLP